MKHFSYCKRGLYLLWSILLLTSIYAHDPVEDGCRDSGIGLLIDHSNVFASLFNRMALLIGICFIIGSVYQYGGYRKNSMNIKLSQPVTMLIGGLALIAISLVPLPFSD